MNRRTPAADYRARADHALAGISRDLQRAGHPKPSGDPLIGVVIVLEQPVGPRVFEALSKSLGAIELPEAYVTCAETGLLKKELRLSEPGVLVAVGPGAAREIDQLGDPLALKPFSDARLGNPFTWKRNTIGILLPPLSDALDDETEKRRFWTAFRSLGALVRNSKTSG
ncbi:hypothetical protein [Rubrobacter indicoceani]|uniref:hypothetical protein n=1 Tax=Rubrobacter indicoceani TaxID=2051957 RepID=UPI000E5B1460|nr:hypothetical protein [Rubrobacter indicoceani]